MATVRVVSEDCWRAVNPRGSARLAGRARLGAVSSGRGPEYEGTTGSAVAADTTATATRAMSTCVSKRKNRRA
jgi:hypothetical protein